MTAALALAACGGSGDSALKANATATTATTIINQQGGGGTGGGTTGAGTPHGTATATSTPHGTSASNPHGTATATPAATTTTRLNTIKPLPGTLTVAPFFSSSDYTYLAPDSPKTDAYGQKSGVCYGTPPHTEATLAWSASATDFVEINRGSTNYSAEHLDYHFVVQCPDPQVTSLFIVFVDLTAFGPGGEVTREVSFRVDPNYLP